jgi:hypothetical protein
MPLSWSARDRAALASTAADKAVHGHAGPELSDAGNPAAGTTKKKANK